jgi:hypothetical protein
MPAVRNIQAASVQGRPSAPRRHRCALDQGGDGEGEADREADIAEIEQRRMDREADVLQERIQVAPLERRRRRG